MALQDIATVNIALQTSGVTSQGFGTPLFASSHRYFPERVRSYGSLEQAAVDLPTSSAAYAAVKAFYSNSPAPSVVKVGRREADLDLTVAVGSTGASLTVEASDGVTTYSVDVTIAGQADEDATATAIAAAIEADGDVGPLVVASSSTNTVSIDVAASTYTFVVKSLSEELTETYNTTETAADLISAISLEDDDYYFFSADDHTETFVLAAASEIEARKKIYFVSVQEQAALTAYSEGSATDILGKLTDLGYLRTATMFHHTADTTFPECTYVGYNAPFDSGSLTWNNLRISIAPSQDPSTGLALNSTQKGYIADRNAALVEKVGGINVLRGGKVVGNERIDTIRGRDNLEVDMNTELTNLLISQQGSKIPYNDAGISSIEAVVRSVLGRYVVKNFINDNFITEFPRADKVSTADKQARIYQDGTFTAEISGAIENVVVTGVLTLNLG